MCKIRFFIIGFLFLFTNGFAQNYKIVIDAGHGGKDPGNLTHQKNCKDEKHLNLEIAILLGQYISENMKNIELIYTRTDDKFISLEDRVYTANKNSADYFISIHSDSNDIKSIHGSRVHIHDGNFGNSKALANKIVAQLNSTAGRKNLGVQDSRERGGHYYVLENTAMPAVLIECGFMTNLNEENYLNSENGQKQIALAIYRGLKDFLYNESNENTRVKSVVEVDNNNSKDLYKVQIRASTEKIPDSKFKKINMKVDEVIYSEGFFKYKYFVGTGSTFTQAKQIRERVMLNGFEDAFIVKN